MLRYIAGNSFLLGIILFSLCEEASSSSVTSSDGTRHRPIRWQLAQCINSLSQSFVLGSGASPNGKRILDVGVVSRANTEAKDLKEDYYRVSFRQTCCLLVVTGSERSERSTAGRGQSFFLETAVPDA